MKNNLKILGREKSIFQDDFENFYDEIYKKLYRSSVLILGGAGSIGSEVVKLLCEFNPSSITVVDHDENNLTELTRQIRNLFHLKKNIEFTFLPLDYGGEIFLTWLKKNMNFDFVMNFAALKHVRTEKNVYTTMALFETNVLKLKKLLESLKKNKNIKNIFSVSSDKAVNPYSFMGLSKRLMEHTLFYFQSEMTSCQFNSSRFANVAFSNGSLPLSWETRIARFELLPCPTNCKRYFISHRESAEMCILSTFVSKSSSICIPSCKNNLSLMKLEDLLFNFLKEKQLSPVLAKELNLDKNHVTELYDNNRYPVYFTKLDTMGEKPYEEFFSIDENPNYNNFLTIGEITYPIKVNNNSLNSFFEAFENIYNSKKELDNITFNSLKNLVKSIEPGFLKNMLINSNKLDDRI